MYNNNYVFNLGQSKYALDINNLIFCELDEQTEEVFELISKTGTLPEISSDSSAADLKYFVKRGYFFNEKPEEMLISYSFDTANVSFPPVHRCNLNCQYCFAGGGNNYSGDRPEFDRERIDRLLHFVYEDYFKDYKKFRFDFVSGGEPLLNFEAIRYLVEQVREIDCRKQSKSSFFLVTNGTLITDEIIDYLDRENIDLGVSIDGDRELHNLHRPYRDGTGSYEDVIGAIRRIQNSACSARLKDIWALSVITKNTESLCKVLEHHSSLNIQRVQMKILRVNSEHKLGFSQEDTKVLQNKYLELIEYFKYHIDRADLSKLLMILNDNDSFGKMIRRLLLREKAYFRCGAGKNKISFTASGEFYPCDSFCGMQPFLLGKIGESTEGNVKAAFYKGSVCERDTCSKCWAKYICGGDCYHNSYLKNRDMMIPDSFMCEMNKFFIKQSVDLLCYLYKTNPRLIARLQKNLSKREKIL